MTCSLTSKRKDRVDFSFAFLARPFWHSIKASRLNQAPKASAWEAVLQFHRVIAYSGIKFSFLKIDWNRVTGSKQPVKTFAWVNKVCSEYRRVCVCVCVCLFCTEALGLFLFQIVPISLTNKQTKRTRSKKKKKKNLHNSCACGFSTVPTPALFSEGIIITLIGSSSAWYCCRISVVVLCFAAWGRMTSVNVCPLPRLLLGHRPNWSFGRHTNFGQERRTII